MPIDELFAAAVERLQAGESLDAVVAKSDPAEQAELRSLLLIAEQISVLALQPVPQPSAVRRDAFRSQFLIAAALREVELQTVQPTPAPAPVQSQPGASPWEQLLAHAQAIWRAFFDVPVLRLAPLAMVIIIVAMTTSWAVAAAKVIDQDNPIYPIKQWVGAQQIQLSPPSVQLEAIEKRQLEVLDELERIAERNGQSAPRDRNQLMPESTDNFVYYGQERGAVQSGVAVCDSSVSTGCQRSSTCGDGRSSANLTPGSTVRLTYKVLPGSPNAVQGVRMEVLDSIPSVPTPTATPPLASGEGDSICIPDPPDEWISVLVQSGATLHTIAAKYGVSAETIQRVNCMTTDELPDRLWLPYRGAVEADLPTPTPLPPATGQEPQPEHESLPTTETATARHGDRLCAGSDRGS